MDVAVMEAPGVAPQNLSESGSWLCSRHPKLRALVEQIGAWQDGMPVMYKVRDTVNEFDRIAASANGAKGVGAVFRPRHTEVGAMLVMAPSEVNRLRMLATLSPANHLVAGVNFSVFDIATFDAVDRDLIYDWLRAVRMGVLG